MFKSCKGFLLGLFMMVILMSMPVFAADTPIKVTVNNVELSMDVSPIIKQGRIFVPLRSIFEATGATVKWDPAKQQIIGNKGSRVIVLYLNNTRANTDTGDILLDAAPMLFNNRVMVPARFVAESLGYIINWDHDTRTVDVSNEPSIDSLEFEDGTEYVGDMIDNKPNGQGSYTWLGGDTYVGEWKDGLSDGKGTMYHASGDVYVGEWRNGLRNGQGSYTWVDGTNYTGEYKDNLCDGQGTFTAASGIKTTGTWSNDYYVPTQNVANTTTNISNAYSTPWTLYSNDGKIFIGEISSNKFDTNNIWNTYGTYGSKYSTKSIWNTYGTYGSKYSNESAFNKFASSPPVIYDNTGTFIGYLTINQFKNKAYTIVKLESLFGIN